MKGVILAGGRGTRLRPLTQTTNKHLLWIHKKPMIYYPIETLKDAGITNILIIVGGESVGDFLKLLQDGSELGVNITYRVQKGSDGIPAALSLAKDFIGDDKFMMVLGDNIMQESLADHATSFSSSDDGARIFVKEVHDPQRYGVVEIENGRVTNIEEKPKEPKTNLAEAGVYLFDASVFDMIPNLKKSGRGELEIVDIHNQYIKEGRLGYHELQEFWTDAGTFESLYEAATMVREHELQK